MTAQRTSRALRRNQRSSRPVGSMRNQEVGGNQTPTSSAVAAAVAAVATGLAEARAGAGADTVERARATVRSGSRPCSSGRSSVRHRFQSGRGKTDAARHEKRCGMETRRAIVTLFLVVRVQNRG